VYQDIGEREVPQSNGEPGRGRKNIMRELPEYREKEEEITLRPHICDVAPPLEKASEKDPKGGKG